MGFDREKIVGNVNENCICAICQDVLEDAVQAKGENFLTRRLSGFEILNNVTLIFQKWLVSRHFGNIFLYLNKLIRDNKL